MSFSGPWVLADELNRNLTTDLIEARTLTLLGTYYAPRTRSAMGKHAVTMGKMLCEESKTSSCRPRPRREYQANTKLLAHGGS